MLNNVIEQLLNKHGLENNLSLYNKDVQAVINALEYNLMSGTNSISTVYWSGKVDKHILYAISKVLSDIGIINSVVSRKWASISINLETLYSYIPEAEVLSARKYFKFKQYAMTEDTTKYASTLVKTAKGVQETGLNRPGFNRVSKCTFKLDQEYLGDYFEPIYANVVKSMTKAKAEGKLKDKYFADQANFEILVREVLEYYLVNDGQYNFEQNISDSRGRSIYNVVRRIANPVASKDIRALLISTESTLVATTSTAKLNDVYYFIAELVGTKAKSEQTKVAQGRRYYRMRKLPELDLTLEADRKDLHELIWLERIYDKLDLLYVDKVVHWDIPLEIDCSMSLNQIVGAVTGESRLLSRTNVIGDELTDPWAIAGVRRLSGKLVGTPT